MQLLFVHLIKCWHLALPACTEAETGTYGWLWKRTQGSGKKLEKCIFEEWLQVSDFEKRMHGVLD